MDPLSCEPAAPLPLPSPAMNQLSRRFPADVTSQPFPIPPRHKLHFINTKTSGIIHFPENRGEGSNLGTKWGLRVGNVSWGSTTLAPMIPLEFCWLQNGWVALCHSKGKGKHSWNIKWRINSASAGRWWHWNVDGDALWKSRE